MEERDTSRVHISRCAAAAGEFTPRTSGATFDQPEGFHKWRARVRVRRALRRGRRVSDTATGHGRDARDGSSSGGSTVRVPQVSIRDTRFSGRVGGEHRVLILRLPCGGGGLCRRRRRSKRRGLRTSSSWTSKRQCDHRGDEDADGDCPGLPRRRVQGWRLGGARDGRSHPL